VADAAREARTPAIGDELKRHAKRLAEVRHHRAVLVSYPRLRARFVIAISDSLKERNEKTSSTCSVGNGVVCTFGATDIDFFGSTIVQQG
jgi:hypothetical protein